MSAQAKSAVQSRLPFQGVRRGQGAVANWDNPERAELNGRKAPPTAAGGAELSFNFQPLWPLKQAPEVKAKAHPALGLLNQRPSSEHIAAGKRLRDDVARPAMLGLRAIKHELKASTVDAFRDLAGREEEIFALASIGIAASREQSTNEKYAAVFEQWKACLEVLKRNYNMFTFENGTIFIVAKMVSARPRCNKKTVGSYLSAVKTVLETDGHPVTVTARESKLMSSMAEGFERILKPEKRNKAPLRFKELDQVGRAHGAPGFGTAGTGQWRESRDIRMYWVMALLCHQGLLRGKELLEIQAGHVSLLAADGVQAKSLDDVKGISIAIWDSKANKGTNEAEFVYIAKREDRFDVVGPPDNLHASGRQPPA